MLKITIDNLQQHLYNILFKYCTQVFSIIQNSKDIWGKQYGSTRFSY